MSSSDFAIVILAAGKGTRLRSNRAKVLHRAGGRALVEHVVRACQPLGAKKIFAVVGHQADDVRAALEPLGVEAVLQQPQHGTGHALLVARRAIGNRVKHVLVLPGDAPLIGGGTLRSLLQVHRNANAAATILTAVVEESQLSEEQRTINEINSSMYCFALDKLWPALARLKPNNTHRELYLTDVVAVLSQQGDTVLAQVAADAQEVLGCNTRAELGEVDRIFRARKSAALMEAGVTIRLPETVVIDPDVQAGEDTVIEPCVQLLGKTRLGARCTIRTGSLLTDAQLADGVTIEPYCVIASSRIDSGAVVGPFARLRRDNHVRAGAHIGNFVELKKTVMGEGTKANHLAYLGDARIGRNTNIGAGTITCNYDGVAKHPTTIGNRVFIGTDSALVAPVRIGDGAYVAAGSVITENVPADALAIARGRQANKPNWAAKRRRELAAAEKPKKSRRAKSRARRKSRPRKSARRR